MQCPTIQCTYKKTCYRFKTTAGFICWQNLFLLIQMASIFKTAVKKRNLKMDELLKIHVYCYNCLNTTKSISWLCATFVCQCFFNGRTGNLLQPTRVPRADYYFIFRLTTIHHSILGEPTCTLRLLSPPLHCGLATSSHFQHHHPGSTCNILRSVKRVLY